KDNEALESDKLLLSYRLDTLLHRVFGRSSERLGPEQLPLFDVASTVDDDVPPAETEEIRYRRKKKQGHGRAPFPDHLPREVIEIDPPEDERTPGVDACPPPARPRRLVRPRSPSPSPRS